MIFDTPEITAARATLDGLRAEAVELFAEFDVLAGLRTENEENRAAASARIETATRNVAVLEGECAVAGALSSAAARLAGKLIGGAAPDEKQKSLADARKLLERETAALASLDELRAGLAMYDAEIDGKFRGLRQRFVDARGKLTAAATRVYREQLIKVLVQLAPVFRLRSAIVETLSAYPLAKGLLDIPDPLGGANLISGNCVRVAGDDGTARIEDCAASWRQEPEFEAFAVAMQAIDAVRRRVKQHVERNNMSAFERAARAPYQPANSPERRSFGTTRNIPPS